MNGPRTWHFAVCATLAVTAATASARADGVEETQARSHAADEIHAEADRERAEVDRTTHAGFRLEAFGGYGSEGSANISNDLGTGLGLRGGYLVPSGFYFGLDLTSYSGTTASTGKSKSFYIAPELGYEAVFSHFSVRAYLAAGFVSDEQASPDADTSRTGVAFIPGLAGFYHLGRFYFGADLRYAEYLVQNHGGGAAAFADVGFRF
jgi:hypothetical protein